MGTAGRWTLGRVLVALAVGSVAMAISLATGTAVVSAAGRPSATAATHCKPISIGEPCLGPIQSGYAYDGFGGGDDTYIHAKAGPKVVVEKGGETGEVTERTFTWHSIPSVEMVAVFIVSKSNPDSRTFHYTRVKTGRHSGHVAMRAVFQGIPPTLLLEGRHIAR